MKKRWLLLSVAALAVLVLSACTGAVDNTGDPAGEEISQAATASTDNASDNGAGVDEIDAAGIFTQRCSTCHGLNREGANGPPLLPGVLNKDASAYINTITNGSGPMPSWKGRLSADEIDAMVEYIMSEVE